MLNALKNARSLWLWFVLGNLFFFFAYRVFFLNAVVPDSTGADYLVAALYGLRLDVALLALELSFLCLIVLLLGALSYRAVAAYLWGWTYLHLFICAANLVFFQERNQHLWGMFLTHISQPSQIVVAVAPLLMQAPWLSAASVILTAVFCFVAYRHVMSFGVAQLGHVKSAGARRKTLGIMLLLAAVSLEPIRIKTNDWPLGWILRFTASRYYMTQDDYLRNQTVVNPVHDFLTYHLPAELHRERGFQTSREAALRIVRTTLDMPQQEQSYALLREMRANADLGIENVVLLIVEGLTESLIHHDEDNQPVMPFLRRLEQESLYFANIYQSFNSTDGSIFATVTGFPETFVARETKDFLAYDLGGHYPSLPRILKGAAYDHFYFQGFRHRHQDFLGFFRNQNYTTYGLDYFEARLRDDPSGAAAVNALGVFDQVFLLESAEVLAKAPKKFTATIQTATSHSPWSTPNDFARVFNDKHLNTFRYVDQAIDAFMARMKEKSPRFEQTLFVIVGDHTSVIVEKNLGARLRVPLFIYNANISAQRNRWSGRVQGLGSHVDIVPTILGLLGQPFCYSGMGKDLLAESSAGRGVISGNLREGHYLKNNLMLLYAPYFGIMELYGIENRLIGGHDLAKEQAAGAFAEMKGEYLALYETSKRLTREANLFPLDDPRACMSH